MTRQRDKRPSMKHRRRSRRAGDCQSATVLHSHLRAGITEASDATSYTATSHNGCGEDRRVRAAAWYWAKLYFSDT